MSTRSITYTTYIFIHVLDLFYRFISALYRASDFCSESAVLRWWLDADDVSRCLRVKLVIHYTLVIVTLYILCLCIYVDDVQSIILVHGYSFMFLFSNTFLLLLKKRSKLLRILFVHHT